MDEDIRYNDMFCYMPYCMAYKDVASILCYWHKKIIKRYHSKMDKKCLFKSCLNERFENLPVCNTHRCNKPYCPFPVFDYRINIYCEKHKGMDIT